MQIKKNKTKIIVLCAILLAVFLVPSIITFAEKFGTTLAVNKADNDTFYNSWSEVKEVEEQSAEIVSLNYDIYDFRSNVLVHVKTTNDLFKPYLSKKCFKTLLAASRKEDVTIYIKPYFVFDKGTNNTLTLKGCFYEYRFDGRDKFMGKRKTHTGYTYIDTTHADFETILVNEMTYQYVGNFANASMVGDYGLTLPLNNVISEHVVTYAGYSNSGFTNYIQNVYNTLNEVVANYSTTTLNIPENYFTCFVGNVSSSINISADIRLSTFYKNSKAFIMPSNAEDLFVQYIKSGVTNA